MGIYQFYARRYDIATSTYIDNSPRVFGFAVCTYQPFPENRSSTNQDMSYLKYTSNNVMAAVNEVRDVCGKATQGVKFLLTSSTTDNYFVFHEGNVFPGGFRRNGVDYTICTSAGKSIYKMSVLNSEEVVAGTRTGSESLVTSGNHLGKFWIYGGDSFTSESANAFKTLINLAPAIDDKYSDVGLYPFYAKRYDVANNQWIDTEFKMYSFALCLYYPWPQATTSDAAYVRHLDSSYLTHFDDTNIFLRMTTALLPSGADQIKFCLTNSTTDNYFYFFRAGYRDGGFVYNGVDHPYIFGSQGSQNSRRAVISEPALTEDTQTGTWYQAWVNVTIASGAYDLICQYRLGSALNDFINLINMSPGDREDPFDGGGTSTTSGGNGNYDNTSDTINIPSIPAVSSSESGFITLYNPSKTDLKNLASYMWANPLFDINGWKKIFSDPMQAILGLSIIPVNIQTSGYGTVTVGNISTDVSMPVVSNQYVIVNCGSLQINEYWGAYLDYEPYTKIEIYLPYCGIHSISADDVVGKSISVVYHVDVLSGACCAYIKCGGSILYTYIGQCASSIPITGDNWTNAINGVLSAAVSIGSMVATGGQTAPIAIPSLASTAINSMKPSIERSGAMGGTGGMLAYQKPYLIITRPRQALPANQNKFTGYPLYVTSALSSLKGYTEIESIHLEGISATKEELEEIEKLLKEGVIF